MVSAAERQSSPALTGLVEQVIAAGQMNRSEHIQLTSALLADHFISDEERRRINRVLDYIQIGRLRLVD